jgi:hypothetical protein
VTYLQDRGFDHKSASRADVGFIAMEVTGRLLTGIPSGSAPRFDALDLISARSKNQSNGVRVNPRLAAGAATSLVSSVREC